MTWKLGEYSNNPVEHEAQIGDRREQVTRTVGDYVLTRRFFEEARDWLLLDGMVRIAAPLHILQGREDDVVPWRHQIGLLERLTGGDARLDLIAGGDHRLSGPPELARLVEAVETMRGRAGAG